MYLRWMFGRIFVPIVAAIVIVYIAWGRHNDRQWDYLYAGIFAMHLLVTAALRKPSDLDFFSVLPLLVTMSAVVYFCEWKGQRIDFLKILFAVIAFLGYAVLSFFGHRRALAKLSVSKPKQSDSTIGFSAAIALFATAMYSDRFDVRKELVGFWLVTPPVFVFVFLSVFKALNALFRIAKTLTTK